MLFISHSREVGGAEVYLENVISHMSQGAEAGRWRPQLVCRRDQVLDAWADEMSAHCEVFRLDVVRLDDALRLTSLIRRSAAVHLNLSFPAGKYQFAAALLARACRRPLVVTHHLAISVPQPWRRLMRWLGRSAQRHIVVSERTRAMLIHEFGYRPEKVTVIYNGVDPKRFRPVDETARKALRERFGQVLEGRAWGDDVRLICSVARLSPQKGLFELVAAADIVVKQEPEARLVVIGEGELRRQLEQQVRERGLDRKLFLAGALPRSQVAEWLAAADLFILPSRYEGGPATALMEAMASGCAVIATNVSGVDELIADGTLGRLVPPQDADQLAKATVELLGDPAARARMAESARQKVVAGFTIAISMERTLAVFDDLLKRAPA